MTSPVKVFNDYKNKKLGKRVDVDNAWGYQCVDLMRDYSKFANYPKITTRGNAIDLWNKGLGNSYTRVYNSLFSKPPVGAIVFWKQGKYGHVAIAGRSNLLWMEVLEQNGGKGTGTGLGSDSIRLRKDYYHNCLGWYITKK